MPDVQTLVCGWHFILPDVHSSTGYSKFYVAVPFEPSFSTALQACEAGRDHLFPEMLSRAADQGPSVKAAPSPSGCVGWEELSVFAQQVEIGMYREDVNVGEQLQLGLMSWTRFTDRSKPATPAGFFLCASPAAVRRASQQASRADAFSCACRSCWIMRSGEPPLY